MKVNFRVVGMHFGANSTEKEDPENKGQFIPNPDAVVATINKEKPIVLDVMREVSAMAKRGEIPKVDMFSFYPDNPEKGDDIREISINFTEKPREMKPYGPGLYVLTDSTTSEFFTTFQYYIYDKDFKQLNKDNKFKAFSDDPDAHIEDGSTIIIRQVKILRRPEENPKIVGRAKRANERLNPEA